MVKLDNIFMKNLIKYMILSATSLTLISCASTTNKTASTKTIQRSISSEASCLGPTRDFFLKENIHLRLPHRYWTAASIICAQPDQYDLDRIAILHKDLKDKKYYYENIVNKDIGFYTPLLVSIYLNGDESKLDCLQAKVKDLKDSTVTEVSRLSRPNKYLIAARLCSK